MAQIKVPVGGGFGYIDDQSDAYKSGQYQAAAPTPIMANSYAGPTIPAQSSPTYVARAPGIAGTPLPGPGGTPLGTTPGAVSSMPTTGSIQTAQATQVNNDLAYMNDPTQDPNVQTLEGDLKKVIEAINKQFDSALSAQTNQNNVDYSATNAVNAGAGLSGSPEGASNLNTMAAKGRNANAAIEAQRATAITSVTQQVDQAIIAEQKARVTAANADMKTYLETLSSIQTGAQTAIGSLALGGVSLDDFASKNPAKYQTLLDQAGWDENQAKAAWIAAKPKDAIVGQQQMGNSMVFFTQGPDGKITSTSLELGMKLQQTDDVQTMPDGSIVVQHWTGKPGDPGSKLTGVEVAPGTKQGQFAAFKAGAGGVIYNSAGVIQSSISNSTSFDITIPASSALAAQNNNPGNLRFANQPGATLGASGFAKFADPQAGFRALIEDVTAKMQGQGNLPIPDGPNAGKPLTGQSSIEDMARVYAPTADKNDPATWAANVAKMLGVDPTAVISTLDPTTLAAAVAAQESSTTVAPAASALNDWVATLPQIQQNDLKKMNLSPTQLQNVKAIADGTRPPLSGYGANSKEGIAIAGALGAIGYDLSKATLDWQGEQKYVASLNSATQIRLRQATKFAGDSLSLVDDLNSKAEAAMSRSQITKFSEVQKEAALQGVYGEDVKSAFTQLVGQVRDLQSEIAVVYKGGNSPTDQGLQQAAEILNTNWDYQTMKDNVNLIRRNLNIRLNSINVGAIGAGGTNLGTPSSSGASGDSDPLGIL